MASTSSLIVEAGAGFSPELSFSNLSGSIPAMVFSNAAISAAFSASSSAAFFFSSGYALKDPRSSLAKPFYIGKGTGSRAYDHLVTPDSTRKYARIKDIVASGYTPLIDILVDDLSEAQALRLEAEMISAFGTEETGGLLTNSVVPAGLGGKSRKHIVVPQGAVERAQLGLDLLKASILELAKANPEGITNADAASLLGLRSDYRGRQKDYLSYSVLGLLLREGKVARKDHTSRHVART